MDLRRQADVSGNEYYNKISAAVEVEQAAKNQRGGRTISITLYEEIALDCVCGLSENQRGRQLQQATEQS